MRRALVTGATGGLGRALATALLAQGYRVRATGRNLSAGEALAASGVAFAAADLTDPSAARDLINDIDVVFHAAALSSPWGSRAAFQAVNVDATRHLVAAAQAAGCDAFIFVSSPSIYAEPRDRLGLTENSPVARRFANAYATTKYAAEQLVLAADRPGFTTVAVRPRALVGPDDRVLLPRLARVARRGKFPLFHEGRALIELTDVRDAAEALVTVDARRETIGGQVFNISGGAPTTVVDMLKQVFSALGLSPRLVDLPYPLAAAVCKLAEVGCAGLPGRPEPPVTAYSLSTLAFSQTFDLSLAAERLGWSPTRSPQQAIERAAGAWRRHAPL